MILFNLVLKDIRTSRRYLLPSLGAVFLLMVFALSLMLDDGGHIRTGLYLTVVLGSCQAMALFFIKMDDLYNADAVYASLPLERSSIVTARYITSILMILVVLTLAVLAPAPAAYFQQNFSDPAFELMAHPVVWAGLFLVLLILISLSFPFYFRFGLGRGMVVIVLSQFILIGLGLTLWHFLPAGSPVYRGARSVFNYVTSLGDAWIPAAALIAVALLFVGSVRLSCRFYNQIDL